MGGSLSGGAREMKILLASSSSGSRGRRRTLPALSRPRARAARSRGDALGFVASAHGRTRERLRRVSAEVLRADYRQHLRPARALDRELPELRRIAHGRRRVAGGGAGLHPSEQTESRRRARPPARGPALRHSESRDDPPHAKRALSPGEARRACAISFHAATLRRYPGLLVTVLENRAARSRSTSSATRRGSA